MSDDVMRADVAALMVVQMLLIEILDKAEIADKSMVAELIGEAAETLPDEESPYCMKATLLKLHQVMTGDRSLNSLTH